MRAIAGFASATTDASELEGVDTVEAAGATASRSTTRRSTILWSRSPTTAMTPTATHAPTPPATSATTHGGRPVRPPRGVVDAVAPEPPTSLGCRQSRSLGGRGARYDGTSSSGPSSRSTAGQVTDGPSRRGRAPAAVSMVPPSMIRCSNRPATATHGCCSPTRCCPRASSLTGRSAPTAVRSWCSRARPVTMRRVGPTCGSSSTRPTRSRSCRGLRPSRPRPAGAGPRPAGSGCSTAPGRSRSARPR